MEPNKDVEMKLFKSNIPETVENSIYDRICALQESSITDENYGDNNYGKSYTSAAQKIVQRIQECKKENNTHELENLKMVIKKLVKNEEIILNSSDAEIMKKIINLKYSNVLQQPGAPLISLGGARRKSKKRKSKSKKRNKSKRYKSRKNKR